MKLTKLIKLIKLIEKIMNKENEFCVWLHSMKCGKK